MRKEERERRQRREHEVRTTGFIPTGTDVHHSRLRNPSIAYLRRVIDETERLIAAGQCHPDWGAKRIAALQQMLDAKAMRRQSKRHASER